MVVKMMRWRPWPPILSKKFEVKLIVRSLDAGSGFSGDGSDKEHGFSVEIRWKGPKVALGYFRRTTVKRNLTREERMAEGSNGVVQWDEEFQSVCSLLAYKDSVIHPWEITFTVLNGLNIRHKKPPVFGVASLNLAEYASGTEESEFELNIPVAVSGCAADVYSSLCVSLSLLELRTAQDPTDSVQRSIVPIPSSPRVVESLSPEKDELSALKAGLRKVKILTEYVSARRAKKACREDDGSEGRYSARSEEGEYAYPFDTDSLDDFEEGESDEVKEDSSVRKSFSYGTLAYANCVGESYYSSARINGEAEDWIYYSHGKSDIASSKQEDSAASVSHPYPFQNSKRSILPWRKRKLSFRSPKAKGEPLLKKDYGEEGGDDIDFDRRQLSSDESISLGWQKTDDFGANRSSVSEFGDDSFAVGTWELKELMSRDGHMKLETQIFFASIDQRSERAAGESACTALVAVIADWLQNNRDFMPIKSQFDSLIREGSLEWRNLCENEIYRERFPDKHFDLETVLQAEIRPLSVVPGKSFIGFFHPDGMEEGKFDFLQDAMSFDSIWDEISRAASECQSFDEPQVYIVSWNDHFFVLKVEREAYYIIDTLGERLFEGCDQAYILKFDRNTTIYRLPNALPSLEDKTARQTVIHAAVETKNQPAQQINPCEEPSVAGTEAMMKGNEEEVVFQGKESCKEYIKSFLAAIPIRELQADIKRGLISSAPLHHRLQIEFHYTHLQEAPPTPSSMDISFVIPDPIPQEAEVALTEVIPHPIPQEAKVALTRVSA